MNALSANTANRPKYKAKMLFTTASGWIIKGLVEAPGLSLTEILQLIKSMKDTGMQTLEKAWVGRSGMTVRCTLDHGKEMVCKAKASPSLEMQTACMTVCGKKAGKLVKE